MFGRISPRSGSSFRGAGSLTSLAGATVIALVLSASACGFPKTAPPPAAITAADVASAQASWADASEASLTSGRSAFLTKCNGCHDYPSIGAVAEDQWPATMTRMAAKAKLTGDEERDTLRFVLTRSHTAPRP